jgi:hypothetical protein
MQNMRAVRAVLWWLFDLDILKLAEYDKRDMRASIASWGDISRTSASLLKRTLLILESSLSVPDTVGSATLIGTNEGSLCKKDEERAKLKSKI